MEDAVGVRKLFELIFAKNLLITEEMTAPGSSFPACLLTDDFSRKLRQIYMVKEAIVTHKWSTHLENYSFDRLPTYLDYLELIISTCFNEHHCHQNIFESFISVCSTVRSFSHVTFEKKGLNFGDLNFDIMMEFYDTVLKEPFRRCGGFHRLVKYIQQHRFNAWEFGRTDVSELNATSPPARTDLVEKLRKEISGEKITLRSVQPNLDKIRASVDSMVQRIISTTSVDLSMIPRDDDSNLTEGTSGLSDEDETAEGIEGLKLEDSEEIFQGCSNSDSKTNQVVKRNEGNAWYESIVQAVIKYNHSKTSGFGTSDDRLKKAEEILKHLKDTIESLIDVLDEYDEE